MIVFNDKQDIGVLQKLLTVLVCFFIPVILGQFITSVIVKLTGFNYMGNLGAVTSDMSYEINIIKSIQFINSFCMFVIPPVLIAKIFGGNAFGFLKLRVSPNFNYYILLLFFLFATRPLLALIVEWNESVTFPEGLKALEDYFRNAENSNRHITDLMLTGSSYSSLFINLLLIGLLPALGEEFLFRGVIQTYLNKWIRNHHIAILITSFIFSAIHFQFFGFVPRFLLGVMFGYIVYYSGSLWPTIFAHFVNNGIAVIAYFYLAKSGLSQEMDKFGSSSYDIWLLVIGTICAIFAGRYLFRKKETEL